MNMFTVITDIDLIRKYQAEFMELMTKALNKRTVNEIGFKGDSIKANVYSCESMGIWCSLSDYIMNGSRYWNAFGIGTPDNNTHIHPVVELNIPNGLNRRVGGVFLTDEKNNVYLGHRGKIGGGKLGIGKESFFKRFKGEIVKASDNDYHSSTQKYSDIAIISSLHDSSLPANIKEFILAVKEIKDS